MDDSRLCDATAELRATVAELRSAYAHSDLPVSAMDPEGRRIYSNEAFDDLVEYRGERLLGLRPPYPYWDPENVARMMRAFDGTLSGDLLSIGVVAMRCTYRPASGRVLEVIQTGDRLRAPSGEALGTVAAVIGTSLRDERERREPPAGGLEPLLRLRRGPREGSAPETPLATSAAIRALPVLRPLTKRETEILQRCLEGYRVPTIARSLSLSPNTVRNHLKSIFRKTGAHSQGELVEKLRGGGPGAPER